MSNSISDALNSVISAGANSAQETIKQPKKTLGKDEFLQLFITQLVHQNPMEPLNNDQFIAQMAQFTAIEQATNTSQNVAKLLEAQQENNELLTMLLASQGNPLSMQMYEGASLIGHRVIAKHGDEVAVQGVVSKVTVSDGTVQVHLENGKSFLISEITEISA